MATQTERRLSVLERRQVATGRPLYVSVQTAAEAQAALKHYGPGPLKVYVGISPDDWDTDNEPSTPVGRA